MIYATLATLRPHKDHEFFSELAKIQNKSMLAKHEELKKELVKGGVTSLNSSTT